MAITRPNFLFLFLVFAFAFISDASPVKSSNGTCTRLNYRKSWNVLTSDEKLDFLRAQKCMMEKPPKVGTIWNLNAKNRWDEFDYTHISLANTTYVSMTLVNSLPGTGGDELKDQATAPLNESAVFDPVLGFGGDGDPNNHYCITDGPFVNVTLAMNASSNFAHDCISRQLNQTRFDQGPSEWTMCQFIGNYTSYWECNSNNIHCLGHIGVGGTYGIMANAVTSTGDPLFFLHHAWLDRAWWKWQLQDKKNRLYQMGGSNMERDFLVKALGLSQPNIYTTDYFGDGGGNETTLNHVLYTHDLRANVTVGDVMDLNGPTICAEYVDDGVFNYTRGW